MARYEVSDELWVRIEPLLPVRARRARWPGRLPLDDRACLNGILFVLLTGISWVDLPQQFGYGSGRTCYVGQTLTLSALGLTQWRCWLRDLGRSSNVRRDNFTRDVARRAYAETAGAGIHQFAPTTELGEGREIQMVSAACPDNDMEWSHYRRLSTTGELRGRRRVIEWIRTLALRDHNLNRPLVSSQLRELDGR